MQASQLQGEAEEVRCMSQCSGRFSRNRALARVCSPWLCTAVNTLHVAGPDRVPTHAGKAPHLLLRLGQPLPELLCNKGHEGVQQPQASIKGHPQGLLGSSLGSSSTCSTDAHHRCTPHTVSMS